MNVPSSYGEALCAVGAGHPEVVVIDLGLGISMQTAAFRDAYPDRYFNLGIAEQNGVGLASGLARRGFVPLVHSFGNFLARRAHDQIAISVAWPGCNVKLIAGSVGLHDGRNGASHMAVDDVGPVAALPGMTVMEPGDLRQMGLLLFRAVAHPGPVYLRLRRYNVPATLAGGRLGEEGTAFLREHPGAACTLVAVGTLLAEALEAAAILSDKGMPVEVVHVAVLRPLDSVSIMRSASRTGRVVVVENHVATGGTGAAVALALAPCAITVHVLGLPDEWLPAGDPQWLLRRCGLDAASIANRIATIMQGGNACFAA